MIFSNLTFINGYLLKTEITLVYQDCLFLKISIFLCTLGVVSSLLEGAALGDGEQVGVAVQGNDADSLVYRS